MGLNTKIDRSYRDEKEKNDGSKRNLEETGVYVSRRHSIVCRSSCAWFRSEDESNHDSVIPLSYGEQEECQV